MSRFSLGLIWMLISSVALAQDSVRYRSRGPRGQRPIQEAKGKIESESLAGVTIAGNLIAARDIVDVDYESPGGIRIDLREARHAEDGRRLDEAIRKYRTLASSTIAVANPPLKRYFEFKVATLLAAKADAGPQELKEATAAMTRWIDDHADGWQRLQAARLLAWLHRDADPPNVEAAVKVFDDLSSTKGCDALVKVDCQIAAIDLYWSFGNVSRAKERLGNATTNDPRIAAYRLALDQENDRIKALRELLSKSEDSLKPTIYNLLGDCHSRNAATLKDALFAYLWVDVVYNYDPSETAKAQDRIAAIYGKMGQDERARTYRDKSRGRE